MTHRAAFILAATIASWSVAIGIVGLVLTVVPYVLLVAEMVR